MHEWQHQQLTPYQTPPQWNQPQPRISYIEDPFPSWAIILHLILTLGTCFCWTPIWIIHYLIHPKRKTIYNY